MKMHPLHRLAAAAMTGTLLLATSALGADDKSDTKPPSSGPSPFTPPSMQAPAPKSDGQRKETVQSFTNRPRSNAHEVNTSPRTAPNVGVAPGGAKRDLDRIMRTGGTTPSSGVRPAAAQQSTSTYRTTLPPASHTTSRSRPTTPQTPPVTTTTSSSPSLRERLRNWLR